jgi:two-component system KDP operon response regulator KdpE
MSSIEEVLRLKDPGKYDLLLLDNDTSPCSTENACRELRACSDMAIIIMSGDNSEEKKAQAILAGANAYLPKPFGVAEMFARVRANMRKARVMTDPQVLVS